MGDVYGKRQLHDESDVQKAEYILVCPDEIPVETDVLLALSIDYDDHLLGSLFPATEVPRADTLVTSNDLRHIEGLKMGDVEAELKKMHESSHFDLPFINPSPPKARSCSLICSFVHSPKVSDPAEELPECVRTFKEKVLAEATRRARNRRDWQLNMCGDLRLLLHAYEQVLGILHVSIASQCTLMVVLSLCSWALSHCTSGPPWYLYIPVGAVALNVVRSDTIVARLLKGVGRNMNGQSVVGRRWKQAIGKSIVKCSPSLFSCDVMNHGVVLKALGMTLVTDLATDSMMPGQVYHCERDDHVFSEQYAQSFASLDAAELIRAVGLSGMFVAMLVVIVLVQWIHGWRQYAAARAAIRMYHSAGMQDAEEDMEEIAGMLADVAEFASASHASMLFREMSGVAFEERLAITRETFVNEHGGAKSAKAFDLLLGNIVRVVFFENAISLPLTTAFLCLQVDHLDWKGCGKVVFSLLVAALGVAAKTKDAGKIGCAIEYYHTHVHMVLKGFLMFLSSICGVLLPLLLMISYLFLGSIQGKTIAAVASLVLLFSTWCIPSRRFRATVLCLLMIGILSLTTIKVVCCFICESHFVSLVERRCVPAVIPSNATTTAAPGMVQRMLY